MHEQLLVPGGYGAERISFEKVLQVLPVLNQARYELNVVTGDHEYVAPEGFAFRVTGEFAVSYHSSDYTGYGPPLESLAAIEHYMRDNPNSPLGEFDEYGDRDFTIVPFDPARYPTEFIGERLKLDIHHNGYKSNSGFRSLGEDERTRTRFSVLGPLDAWYDGMWKDFSWQKSSDSTTYGKTLIDIPLSTLVWSNDLATANSFTGMLDLVPYNRPQVPFKVIELQGDDAKLQIAYDARSVEHSIEFANWKLFSSIGVEYVSEVEAKLHIMRYRRMQGDPVHEDPLKNFILLRDTSKSLDEIVVEVMDGSGPPPSWEEENRLVQEMIEKSHHERQLRLLRSSIAIIASVRPLSELVADLTGPDWAECELDTRYTHDWIWSRKDQS